MHPGNSNAPWVWLSFASFLTFSYIFLLQRSKSDRHDGRDQQAPLSIFGLDQFTYRLPCASGAHELMPRTCLRSRVADSRQHDRCWRRVDRGGRRWSSMCAGVNPRGRGGADFNRHVEHWSLELLPRRGAPTAIYLVLFCWLLSVSIVLVTYACNCVGWGRCVFVWGCLFVCVCLCV
jgi:hypothetical protein